MGVSLCHREIMCIGVSHSLSYYLQVLVVLCSEDSSMQF